MIRRLLPSLILAALAACDRGKQTTAPAARGDSAEQIAFGVRHQLVSDRIRRGELRADSAFFYDGGNRIELRGVQLTLFSVAGDTLSSATSRVATYALQAKRVTLSGGVSVRARDGRSLVAPRVTFDASTTHLSGDSAYTLAGAGASSNGTGFELDGSLRPAKAATSRVRPRAK